MRQTSAALIFATSLIIFIPIRAEANSGDFNGGVAIGSSYAGASAAPTDGLIVQGNVGIGTTSPISGTALTVNGVFDANALMLNGLPAPLPSGGRLTLSSNTPVMTGDVTAATTVYYTDYNSDLVPVYNGTNWIEYALGGQISLALDSTSTDTGYQQSGSNYDLFVGLNSGTLELCTGPAWSSNSSRGTGSGTTQIQMLNGIWTNENSMTCRYGSSSGNTFTCAANQCTFVGSMRATANGQTGFKCLPGPTAGGSADAIAISNAYNQVPVSCIDYDSSGTWTYASTTVRAANGSASNSVAVMDVFSQPSIKASYTNDVSSNSAGTIALIGIGVDSTSSITAQTVSASPTSTVGNNWQQPYINYNPTPGLGFHTIYAVEYCSGGGTCSYGAFGNSMVLTVTTIY